MSAATAVRAAIRIENEVVYGYGVVGAHLRGHARRQAAERLSVHEQRRDDLHALVTDAPAAHPAYALPFPVADSAAAMRLAVLLEDASAKAAWALAASTAAESRGRRIAVDTLADAATAATHWRQRSGRTDDPALPGQPVADVASQPSTTPTTSPSTSTTASGSTS